MGRATITNNLGSGRYRIKIDSGEARRTELLAAANEALAIVGDKLIDAQEEVVIADEQEAASRASIDALISDIIAAGDENDAAYGAAYAVLDVLIPQYAQQIARNQAVRQQLVSLKNTQANLIRQRATWESLLTVTYKEAWCTDYTTNASTSSLNVYATIDIPGDPSLTLLVPGCRQFRQGDGNISTVRKAAALARLSTELIAAGTKLAQAEASLATKTAREVELRAEVAAAQAAYVAMPTDENYALFERKTEELNAIRGEIANLHVVKQLAQININRLNLEIAFWTGRAAVETPYAGDGAFLDRALVSPAQSYFNAAIFPGWQKWLPTYRWGIASNVDETSNTMDVTLGAATSSAQRLNVNKESFLSRVPVVYMTCHAAAFQDGDRVVVAFANQSFESPTVIGFLDNPVECRPWPESVVMDLFFETLPGSSPGTRDWAQVVAWFEEGPAAGCSGANYRLNGTTPYTARVCESAIHSFRLTYPEFSGATDATYFDLAVTDGNFSTLWTGESSAWLFDIERVPNGAQANSFDLEFLAPGNILLRELTTSGYTQSITHASSFLSAPGECTYVFPFTTGAWLYGGTNAAIEAYPVTTSYPLNSEALSADEFLNFMGARPTAITVTRKRAGSRPSKNYVLDTVTEDSTLPHGGRRWRFTYVREDA